MAVWKARTAASLVFPVFHPGGISVGRVPFVAERDSGTSRARARSCVVWIVSPPHLALRASEEEARRAKVAGGGGGDGVGAFIPRDGVGAFIPTAVDRASTFRDSTTRVVGAAATKPRS